MAQPTAQQPNRQIAVATQKFCSVTKHPGRCRHFIVYEPDNVAGVREVDRLQLPKEISIHAFSGGGPHPLDAVSTLIVGGAKPPFVARMAARGIETVSTSEPDPAHAATLYLAQKLPGGRETSSEQGHRAIQNATEFLKAMANETRLAILGALLLHEKSVSELEHTLGLKQSNVSQQLARLRRAGLVAARPSRTTMYYSLMSPQVRVIVAAVYEAHCQQSGNEERSGDHAFPKPGGRGDFSIKGRAVPELIPVDRAQVLVLVENLIDTHPSTPQGVEHEHGLPRVAAKPRNRVRTLAPTPAAARRVQCAPAGGRTRRDAIVHEAGAHLRSSMPQPAAELWMSALQRLSTRDPDRRSAQCRGNRGEAPTRHHGRQSDHQTFASHDDLPSSVRYASPTRSRIVGPPPCAAARMRVPAPLPLRSERDTQACVVVRLRLHLGGRHLVEGAGDEFPDRGQRIGFRRHDRFHVVSRHATHEPQACACADDDLHGIQRVRTFPIEATDRQIARQIPTIDLERRLARLRFVNEKSPGGAGVRRDRAIVLARYRNAHRSIPCEASANPAGHGPAVSIAPVTTAFEGRQRLHALACKHRSLAGSMHVWSGLPRSKHMSTWSQHASASARPAAIKSRTLTASSPSRPTDALTMSDLCTSFAACSCASAGVPSRARAP